MLLDELPTTNPSLADEIMAPRKQPTNGGDNSDPVGHEDEFTATPDDDVDVEVDEVFEHMDGRTVPDGLEVKHGGLQAASTCAEEAEAEGLGEVSFLPSSSPEQDLGRGMRVRRARNLEQQMAIFHF
ncbi:uncharacterized protein EI90DRAFT_3019272 [Cantharellus anzutake]|uniref:uncharacterized protein n=1 Tax=Cantharellus anzutake TaxID=1750568 RepID=UPI00190311F8|nr:uncharacterized protein EI90DRAFT_3019272 [Cantharellus anzutake]KAF8325095.1 hypothetical protein EI90DRAFT_3019272 [Cantharellus anzutake]